MSIEAQATEAANPAEEGIELEKEVEELIPPNKWEERLLQLQQEYAQLAANAGNLHYQIYLHREEAKSVHSRMKKLNNRAHYLKLKLNGKNKTKSEEGNTHGENSTHTS